MGRVLGTNAGKVRTTPCLDQTKQLECLHIIQVGTFPLIYLFINYIVPRYLDLAIC